MKHVILLILCFEALQVAATTFSQGCSYEQFLKGDYQFQFPQASELKKNDSDSDELKKNDSDSEKMMEKYFQIAELSNQIQNMKLNFYEEDFPLPSTYYDIEHFHEFCELNVLFDRTQGTEASLVTILLLAKKAEGWGKESVKPIVMALEQVIKQFPETWEAKIALMMKFPLIYKYDQSPDQGIQGLLENLPTKDFRMDMEDFLVRNFSKIYPIQNPLRATYLLRIAAGYYNRGFMKMKVEPLDKAITFLNQIIQEFPNSKSEKDALSMKENVESFQQKYSNSREKK